MLNLVRKAFRVGLELLLWINLIVWTVGGGIACYYLTGGSGGRYSSSGNPVLGIFIGLIIGFLINIVGGGLIATILNMDQNLEQLKNKTGSSV